MNENLTPYLRYRNKPISSFQRAGLFLYIMSSHCGCNSNSKSIKTFTTNFVTLGPIQAKDL